MKRRTFAKFVAAPFALADVPGVRAAPKTLAGADSAKMKLGNQNWSDDASLKVLAALGVNHICSALPSRRFDENWSVEGLTRLRERVELYGITLAAVPLPLSSVYITKAENPEIMLGKSPERDREIDNICSMIGNCGKVGIPMVKYNFNILGVVRTARTPGRGGSSYSTFRYVEAKQEPPLTEAGPLSADEMWERISYFLDRVVPVAEEAKVRIACHPHDPGMPEREGFRGIHRVLGSVAGLKRFIDIRPSPYHGLNFCQGTVSEMLRDPNVEIHDVIRYFGTRKKIFNVHFRNIHGGFLSFQETFPDAGDVDMLAAFANVSGSQLRRHADARPCACYRRRRRRPPGFCLCIWLHSRFAASGAGLMPTRHLKAERRKWLIVVLLALGMVIAYVDRANLSAVLALKGLHGWIHLDDNGRGMLNSAFFWSYALLQIPAGWIVDRYGPKRPYAIGFSLWTLASAGAGMAHGIGQLVASRLVLGVGESVSTAASVRWIRLHCTESQRGLATGILFSGTKVGAAIGVPLAVVLILRFSWRMMFIVLGLGGLVWLVAWMFLVPERAHHGQLQNANPIPETQRFPIAATFARPPIWGILLGTFAYNYFIYFCLTWLPAYFTDARHLTPTAMGFFTMFSFGGMALVGILAGWAADRVIARGRNPVRVRRVFTMTGFVIASTELIGMLSKSNDLALFFAVFSLAGLGLTTANYWALTQTIFPAGIIGRMIGIQNFASNVSGIFASLITGWLKQKTGNYEAAGWAILAVLLLGLAAYGLLVRPDRMEATAQKPVRPILT